MDTTRSSADTIGCTQTSVTTRDLTPQTLSPWQRHTARSEVIRATLDRETGTRDGDLSWDTIAGPSGHFDSADDLLRSLQQLWLTRLTARLDQVLELHADDLPAAVADARTALAAAFPSLARVLGRHRAEPALVVGVRTECRLLAVAAGLASLADPAGVAAARGAALIERDPVAGARTIHPRGSGGPRPVAVRALPAGEGWTARCRLLAARAHHLLHRNDNASAA